VPALRQVKFFLSGAIVEVGLGYYVPPRNESGNDVLRAALHARARQCRRHAVLKPARRPPPATEKCVGELPVAMAMTFFDGATDRPAFELAL
jgi:hypothetical protein